MGAEPSLVGRDSEMRTLAGLLDESPLGLARLGLVLGEPGIGKTRLAREFAELSRQAGFDVVTAQAQPGTSTVSAGTLLPLLPSAPPAADDAAVLWWARNTLAAISPRLAVVIDDAHDADEMSIAVCRSLSESHQVPVVFTARSTETWPAGLDALRDVQGLRRIRLEALGRSHTAALVEELQGEAIAPTAASEVHRKTSGVPLLVRELTRAAAEAGVPLSGRDWGWDPAIAADPALESLFEGRLGHVSEPAREVLWMTVVAGGRIPEVAASASLSTEAVTETLERGLLVREGSWLHWSHDLLGEVSTAMAEPEVEAAARRRLHRGMREADLSDPDQLALAAALDLARDGPSHHLQLAAARSALGHGRESDAALHAEAALRARPDCHSAALTSALAAVSVGGDATPAISRALATAARADGLFEATRSIALHIIGSTGDFVAASGVIDLSESLADDPALRGPLESIRIVAGIMALPPEEHLAAADEFLSSSDLGSDDRVRVQGPLSIVLAALGDVEQAEVFATTTQESVQGEVLGYEQDAGFFGGALAALFSGDAVAASQLVERGAALPVDQQIADLAVGHAPLALTMEQARGHCRAGMPSFVAEADAAGSLRYAVLTRIYSVWELALRRDPYADELWDQLQQAPSHLRAGPGFLEAFAGVALLAAHHRVDEAAETALSLAEAMGPARSAAAWLLHDAARHGRAAEAVDRLDQIASTQSARYLPAMFADSARAMAHEDPDGLVGCAAELRAGGFDLFAAELDILASAHLGPSDAAGRRAATRARADLHRSGGPRTPIVDQLDPHPLTDRQREVCSLAAAGLTNREIAEKLCISKRTVENTLHRSYIALGVDRDGLATAEL